MKKLFNIMMQLILIIAFNGCGGSNNNSIDENTDNEMGYLTIDILDCNGDCIDVSIYGGDDDGVKSLETYLIDVHRLNLFNQDGKTEYIMDKDTVMFDETKDSAFDIIVKLTNTNPNTLYTVKSVLSSVNGTITREKNVGTYLPVSTASGTEAITNMSPNAVTSKDRTVVQGQNIALSGSGSTDSDGNIVSYTWYDENDQILNNTISFLHVINTVGTHVVKLVVEDDDGATSSDTVTITVDEKV